MILLESTSWPLNKQLKKKTDFGIVSIFEQDSISQYFIDLEAELPCFRKIRAS